MPGSDGGPQWGGMNGGGGSQGAPTPQDCMEERVGLRGVMGSPGPPCDGGGGGLPVPCRRIKALVFGGGVDGPFVWGASPAAPPPRCGSSVGRSVGQSMGPSVGLSGGLGGSAVGLWVGPSVGPCVGLAVGSSMGAVGGLEDCGVICRTIRGAACAVIYGAVGGAIYGVSVGLFMGPLVGPNFGVHGITGGARGGAQGCCGAAGGCRVDALWGMQGDPRWEMMHGAAEEVLHRGCRGAQVVQGGAGAAGGCRRCSRSRAQGCAEMHGNAGGAAGDAGGRGGDARRCGAADGSSALRAAARS